MTDETKLKPCSYVLFRYVSSLLKQEPQNIGLMLHCPQENYLGSKFLEDFGALRVERSADAVVLSALAEFMRDQTSEKRQNYEELFRISSEFSNVIQATDPSVCLASDPQAKLNELFASHIGKPRDTVHAAKSISSRAHIKNILNAAFEREGIARFIETDVKASTWAESDPFVFDYAYYGRSEAAQQQTLVKLIHALPLHEGARLSKELAYTFGRLRLVIPAGLTAVMDDPAEPLDSNARFIKNILSDAEISVQLLSGVSDYAKSIKSELMV